MSRYRAETLERIRRETEQRTGYFRIEPGGWQTLPEELFALNWLTSMDLTGADLTALPDDFGNRFPELRDLLLFDNQLTSVPESLCSLRRLETLDVSINQLEALPEGLGQLRSLRMLRAGANQLTTLPASIGSLTELEQLSLEDNQLRSIPEEMRALKRLKTNKAEDFDRGLRLDGNPLKGVQNAVFSLEPAMMIEAILLAQSGGTIAPSVLKAANTAAESAGLVIAEKRRRSRARNQYVVSLVEKVRGAPLRAAPDGNIARWLREDMDEDLAVLLAALVFHRPSYAREGAFELYSEPKEFRGYVSIGQDYHQREIAFDVNSPSYATQFVLIDTDDGSQRVSNSSFGSLLENELRRRGDDDDSDGDE